jgi:tRNA-uridine 2-sulfurtransferase
MTRRRVLAALSGGVDSAVAAARAIDAGHDVVAVHLALSRVEHRSGSRGCCSREDARDARRVADVLGIPYYVWDLHEEFTEKVIDDFIAEYAAGHTPNPCLRCNESIKFTAVLDRALALGFDAVCTGHYARIVEDSAVPQLHRGMDPTKDQSYVLGVLEADQVRHCMFPLGDSLKEDVRVEARQRGLLVADKPDSHDICFIPDGDTAGWLAERLGRQSGDIVDALTGERLGSHEGAYAFTIGQRRGLALAHPPDDGQRRYVVDVDVKSHQVFVGPEQLLGVRQITGIAAHWTDRAPHGHVEAHVQVRAHGDPLPATIAVATDGRSIEVRLHESLRGLAPGQAVVMYDGDRVIGSATVDATRP